MSFLISATDICGRVTLRHETADAAFKKAAELVADGYRDVARALGKPSADAARMAVSRALLRLAEEMSRGV